MRQKTSANSKDKMRVLHTPLLQAFRDAARAGDARRADASQAADGSRVVSQRNSRLTSNEGQLRQSLDIDLGHLLNTVNLASSIDLEGYPNVSRSVLNFGMQDLVHLTTESAKLRFLAESLRTALLAHEPRLDASSLEIVQRDDMDEVNQRISFSVSADLLCRPVDVPLEFLAEIDVGSGKVDLRNLTRSARGVGPELAAAAQDRDKPE
jgi:type VI secretion system protein ImpF